MLMPVSLLLLLLLLLLLFLLQLLGLSTMAASAAAPPIALSGCKDVCGNVTIPYPFGIGEACSLEGFNITCNASFRTPKPFLGQSNIDVVRIQLSHGLVVVNKLIAYDCYDKDGNNTKRNNPFIHLIDTPYLFSDSRNKFIAVGCDTIGYIYDKHSGLETGCLSVCNNASQIPNGTCSGIGCCAARIPKGLRAFDILINNYYNHTNCWDFNPCSYAFLVDAKEGGFNFSLDSFSSLANKTKLALTLDWSIGNQTCEEARRDSTSFACKSEHSICLNSTNGPGYLCNCSQGFEGNPYLQGGCQDINECDVAPPNNTCTRICTNTPGSYHCSCPRLMYGDGKVDGSGCKSIKPLLYVILGAGFGLLLLIITSSWLYWVYKKNKLIGLKEKFFQQNGGYLLQQQSSSAECMSHATKLFSAEELKKATDNYDENRILGRGGSGTVYRGILSDKSVVAIKKSRIIEDGSRSEIEQFINEMIILSHINHRNIVKVLGCCLETRVPMLVYEFVSNGTLSHHIHDDSCRSSLSLANRLRIAAETAGALAYLHSAASMPIIHRDVKSTNILLDDNLTIKISDFGTSRFVPFDRHGLTSLVRGTLGYLDPEYLHTSQFTDKSDVYSFGVILVELLTGKSPIIVNKSAEKRNLPMHFVSCLKKNRLFEILEDRVINEGSQELLVAVAELARTCLRLIGEERPTMKEVAMELEGLRKMDIHPWIRENNEKGESLLGEGEFSSVLGEGESSNMLGEGEFSSIDRAFGAGDSSTQVVVPLNIMR